jgi:peptide/nickel transport system permease protein
MRRLIGRRLLLSVALLFMVSALTFFFQLLIPGNAAEAILGVNSRSAALAQLERQLGLNQPVYLQYWHWLSRALHGNLGYSYTTGQAVTAALDSRLWVTLSLIIGATLFALVVGVGLGVLSAVRGGWLGRLVDAVSVLGLAIPSFWLALVLVTVFASALRLFPTSGYTPFLASPAGWAHALVLPVIALGVGAVTLIAKQTRDQMLEVLSRNFILMLRANGISERSVVLRHALKNAAIPVLTVAGLAFVGALGASVFIENVFVLPGLGSALVDATNQHDLPMVQGISVYFTLIVVVVNFLIDLAYGWLNPKVRRAQ